MIILVFFLSLKGNLSYLHRNNIAYQYYNMKHIILDVNNITLIYNKTNLI